jgi:CubicO group peptidase (beta-lactamase class C family)
MDERRQRRVLYREFLFRIVDRELLSAHSTGDASRLLLQLLTLLVCLSALFSVPALFVNPGTVPQAQLALAWSAEHFLVATTMLAAGVFAVLGWGSMFPDQRDVMVLAPLPVRPRTILAAKLAALATTGSIAVLALHAVTLLAWPVRLNTPAAPYTIPTLTSDPAIPPVDAVGLKAALDRALGHEIRSGFLAPGAGGGVTIGVSTRGVRRVFAYGEAAPDSVYPIASITKAFTGLALAHLIEEGAARVDQSIRQLIPDAGLAPPTRGRPEMTLADLVTHRSGLPGMPPGFTSRNPGNPFAGFDRPDLYAFLGAHGVSRPPAARYLYSNVGFGLLGHALAARAGVDYATLVRERITRPLAMTDTNVELTGAQQSRLMRGFDREHRATRAWDVGPALAGAGALKSTVPDLLTWLEANLHPERLPPGALERALRASHRRPGAEGTVAFAWFMDPRGGFGHPGDIAGFSALVWFNPAADRAVAILSNTERGTPISADILGEHIRARLDGVPAIALASHTLPARGGVRSWFQLSVAYVLTMAGAALFVFAAAAGLQGVAAAVLPHRVFLRASSLLQLAVFGTVVGGYFLQPMVVSPTIVLQAQQAPWFASSPSLWFLGLFQYASGSPAMQPLAARAVGGLGVALLAAAVACVLSYVRTLQRLAEAPDLAASVRAAGHLPATGGPLSTAIVHFSARTLLRSAPHRVLFAFYLGIGFALSAVFLKSPRAQALAETAVGGGSWDDTSVALIVSSVVMMACAVVGARLTFAMPRDLAANWIFRVLPLEGGLRYTAARRRTFFAIAVGPVWLLAAAVVLTLWPVRPALAHLILLALFGSVLVELCLVGTQRIPFTCAYLPGGSRTHVTAPLAVVLLLVFAFVGAELERRALDDGALYAALVATLVVAWITARAVAWWLRPADPLPEFEDEPAGRLIGLEL